MRIGILTQPLYCNYGGIVQCYALQTVLKRRGHEAIVLQREWNRQCTVIGACVYYAKLIVKKLLGRKESWHYNVSQKKRDYIARETNKFIERYINPRSNRCYSTEQLYQEANRLHLDAIVVGSDQVWRPDYSPCLPNYFLDFLPTNSSLRRISYAASFGSDTWNLSKELTAECAVLLNRFDAVSVREKSGISLCKKHFNVDAINVLDPTMLLDAKDYMSLFVRCAKKRENLFCYVLDRSQEKKNIISVIAKNTNKTPFESMPELEDSTYNLYGDIDKAVFPPVEDWLSAFNEADMIVTDSFHGTVFSIIFNKPFWVIANERRGQARFDSILSMFNLKNRMISKYDVECCDFNMPIDWKAVNRIREKMKESSIKFLTEVLG